MVSKCANPACSEQFRYLHQGKLFQLTPTPDLQASTEGTCAAFYERFWLCDQCCRQMTLVWGGTKAKLVPLPAKPVTLPTVPAGKVVANGRTRSGRTRRRATHAGAASG